MNNMDFSVKYSKSYCKAELNYSFRYVGIGKDNDFLFLKKPQDNDSCIVRLNSRGIKTEKKLNYSPYLYAEDYASSYYVLQDPLRIVKFDGTEVLCLKVKNGEKYKPLCINVLRNIVISFYPARIMIIDAADLSIILDETHFDLPMLYPISVRFINDKEFIVVDSKNSFVGIFDYSMKTKWLCEKADIDQDVLFSPLNAIVHNDYIYISQRRSHCIIIMGKDKIVRKILGKPFNVGYCNGRLFNPYVEIINGNIYCVSYEGSYIYVLRYDFEKESWKNIGAPPPIKKSDVCHPRSCEYSKTRKELLVADTDHNRIICYDNKGQIKYIIGDQQIPKIKFPRCAIFFKDNVMVADSGNRKLIVYDDMNARCTDIFSFDEKIAKGEWIQSIDYLDNNVLVAFEKEVVVISWENKKIIFNSRQQGYIFSDVHYACFGARNSIVVADNGNKRIAIIRNESIEYIYELKIDNQSVPLGAPRFVRIINDKIYIIDSKISTIYVCTLSSFEVVYRFGEMGLSFLKINYPRWLCEGELNELFISDTANHRIIKRDFKMLFDEGNKK